MTIEIINNIEANNYLKNLGMYVGDWAGIHHIDNTKVKSLSYCPKRDCNDWFVMSTHIASWLPNNSDWTIIQFDHSCSFGDMMHNSYLSSILNISDFNFISLNTRGLLLSDIGNNSQYKFLLSKLIFLFVLFEIHGYIVNSNCKESKELISFQDGCLYFISIAKKSQDNIQNIIDLFQKDRNKYPDWLINENILLQKNLDNFSSHPTSSEV